MYGFELFVEAYLRKLTHARTSEIEHPLYLFCEQALSKGSAHQLTIYKDKAFTDSGYKVSFHQSYFFLYIESLTISKKQDSHYQMDFIHNPRIKDHSRAVEISIELAQQGVFQSFIKTLRGSDDDLWYFLIQLGDFSVVTKFKHKSGIPV